jgi:hypothetical protein
MESIQGFLLAVGWFLLRFGLPVIATLAVCWLFKKIDARWQSEGEAFRKELGIENLVPAIRCWVLNDCPPEKRENCRAYLDKNTPCWQHFRAKSGELKESCIGCGVFRGAPAIVTGD